MTRSRIHNLPYFIVNSSQYWTEKIDRQKTTNIDKKTCNDIDKEWATFCLNSKTNASEIIKYILNDYWKLIAVIVWFKW